MKDSSNTENGVGMAPTVMEVLVADARSDARWVRWAVALAAVLHAGFFAVQWPSFVNASTAHEENERILYVVKQPIFKPPPRQVHEIRRPQVRRVPVPDPTPEEPEPWREVETVEVVTIDDPDWIGIESVPPPPPEPAEKDPIRVVPGGKVTEPRKIAGPDPIYPQVALRAHMEGVVILDCRIDTDGRVRAVKVLRGAPLGLTEAAQDAVSQWRFEPAKLDGRPVEVLYVLTVTFRLNQA